jgi:hypothetical protein
MSVGKRRRFTVDEHRFDETEDAPCLLQGFLRDITGECENRLAFMLYGEPQRLGIPSEFGQGRNPVWFS